SGQPYFNNILPTQSPDGTVTCPGPGGIFCDEPLGQIGDAKRRFFYGPGLNNWDMALLKDTKITESKTLQFRFEAFNIWNHAQFMNPSGVFNPDPTSQFGRVSAARDPRIMQAGLKFLF